jgi:hypothetical protein
MTATIGEVVAQMRVVIEQLDSAVITCSRAQRDASQAETRYRDAGGGGGHPRLREAMAESRIAGDKAGKAARLLAEATNHFSTYLNIIAPGSVPDRRPSEAALPSGERINREAETRAPLSTASSANKPRRSTRRRRTYRSRANSDKRQGYVRRRQERSGLHWEQRRHTAATRIRSRTNRTSRHGGSHRNRRGRSRHETTLAQVH